MACWVMTVDLFLALVVFAFVMSVTLGAQQRHAFGIGCELDGFKRSIPHMLGNYDWLQFFMIAGGGPGPWTGVERFPITYEVMRYGGGAYMLWLAWKDRQFRACGRRQDFWLALDVLPEGRIFPVGESRGLG